MTGQLRPGDNALGAARRRAGTPAASPCSAPTTTAHARPDRPAGHRLHRRHQRRRSAPTAPGRVTGGPILQSRPASTARPTTHARPSRPAGTGPASTTPTGPAHRRSVDATDEARRPGRRAGAGHRRNCRPATHRPSRPPASGSSTSARTWSAGAADARRPGRHDGAHPPRRGAQPGRHALHRQPAHGAGHRPLHASRRRHRDLRADVHLPRLPLRRADRLRRAPPAWTSVTGLVVRHRRRPHRRVRRPPTPWSTSCTATSSGASAATSSPSRPTRPPRDERLGWTGDINVFAPTATFNMDSADVPEQVAAGPARRAVGQRRVPRRRARVPGCGRRRGRLGRRRRHRAVRAVAALRRHRRHRRALRRRWRGTSTPGAEHQLGQPAYQRRPRTSTGSTSTTRPPAGVLGTALLRVQRPAARGDGRRDRPRRRRDAATRRCPGPSRAGVRRRLRSSAPTAPCRATARPGTCWRSAWTCCPTGLRAKAADRARRQRRNARDWHLSTGFLGIAGPAAGADRHRARWTRLPAAAATTTYPSWGYEIAKGATTIWERWDSISPTAASATRG